MIAPSQSLSDAILELMERHGIRDDFGDDYAKQKEWMSLTLLHASAVLHRVLHLDNGTVGDLACHMGQTGLDWLRNHHDQGPVMRRREAGDAS